MSKAIDDGGPAFARAAFDNKATNPADQMFHHPQDDMSLRDWFAGQALIGLLAHTSGEDPRKAPSMAYVLADAMLEARALSQREAGE